MAIQIHTRLEGAFQAADTPAQRLDEFAVRDSLLRALTDVGEFSDEQRRGNFALIGALDFQPRRLHSRPVWGMHWQPLSTSIDGAGTEHHSPDATLVDDEVIQEWSARAGTARHPLLKARYADLAWELTRFRRKVLTRRADVAMARAAVDGYLDAIERGLTSDEIYSWIYIERAIELAASINDAARIQRAKAVLFRYAGESEVRNAQYPFWRFDETAWDHAQALDLSEEDRSTIVQALERQLAARSDINNPQVFDPHLARTAADRLGRWRDISQDQSEGRRAAFTAGAAFEAAAQQASGLTAIAWLSEQVVRYRQLGDEEAVARVEQKIRDRAGDAQGEMQRISVPLNVNPSEVNAWADRMAGNSLDEGLRGFAAAGLVSRESSEREVLDLAEQSPLSAHISISITGADGFTKATIGSVADDLDGRTLYHAAQQLSQSGPFLNVLWERLLAKHAVDLDALMDWLAHCPFLRPRLQFIREGLEARFAGDVVKTIHVLVPQVEAALRDMLAAVGGPITRYDPDVDGFLMVSLGEILRHERFKAMVPEDMRFHFRALYQDPRGLNVRNELAHGIAAFELFGLGLANLVVHSITLIGMIRVTLPQEGGKAAVAAVRG